MCYVRNFPHAEEVDKPKLNGKIFRMGLLTSELHYFFQLFWQSVFFSNIYFRIHQLGKRNSGQSFAILLVSLRESLKLVLTHMESHKFLLISPHIFGDVTLHPRITVPVIGFRTLYPWYAKSHGRYVLEQCVSSLMNTV
jgi:hypothetical protein